MSIEQMQSIVAAVPSGGGFHAPPLEARSNFAATLARLPVSPDVEAEELDVAGVPVIRATVPESLPGRVLLYVHGGAYVAGSARGFLGFATHIARAAKATVWLIDYRLAPEHPFPAAIDDALTVYRQLVAEIGAEHVVVVGDSAGGGLSAALLIAARDAGVPQPAGAALLSPWVDLSLTAPSLEARAERDPILSREALASGADAYLAGADPRAPFASPLFAELSSLAPLTIHVGTEEVLFDDAHRFARAVTAAGGHAEITTWEGMVHDFALFWFLGLDEAGDLIEEVGKFADSQLS